MVLHTVGNALELGAEGVLARCACLHQRIFTPREARALFGAELPISELKRRLKCSACGKRPTTARAAWPRRSRGGSPPQEIVPKDWGRLP